MEKRWIYKDAPQTHQVATLSKNLNINHYLSSILVQRGITSFEEAKDFFRPSLDMLHDPFMMCDMDKAVNRLSEAIFGSEKILVYGDYDVDGTTAVSLLFLFLSQFSDQIAFYIPDRYTEGYGISKKGIDYAAQNDFQLIISLDCGIRAIERAKEAEAAGIDLIICDHHLPGDELPVAFAILDPKRKDCDYPFKELSGCGVGFKLLEAFSLQNTIDKSILFEYIDLLAVSIACDIVPIVGENRVLCSYGLKKLNQKPSAGLKSLIEISAKKNPLNVTDLVFSLGPRINATGRLSHARESVKLLIGSSQKTKQYAEYLNARNKERQECDQSITAEALDMIAENATEKKSTVLFKKSWNKGVVGIVAARCIEHYYRPTIILTESEGKASGSARSVEGFDVHEALSQCSDLLEQYGGHKHAAGLTLPVENVELFIDKFEEVVSDSIHADQLIPKIEIDLEIPLSFCNFKTYSIIRQMAPFGPQNLSPIFGTKNVFFLTKPNILKQKHVKGFLKDLSKSINFEFIGFGLAEKFESLQPGDLFDIAYHIEETITKVIEHSSLI